MRFRSKPVQIEATQFLPAIHQVPLGVEYHEKCAAVGACCSFDGRHFVTGIQGPVIVNDGDWIITEPDGNGFYPCNPEVFARRWEPIVEESPRLMENFEGERGG